MLITDMKYLWTVKSVDMTNKRCEIELKPAIAVAGLQPVNIFIPLPATPDLLVNSIQVQAGTAITEWKRLMAELPYDPMTLIGMSGMADKAGLEITPQAAPAESGPTGGVITVTQTVT